MITAFFSLKNRASMIFLINILLKSVIMEAMTKQEICFQLSQKLGQTQKDTKKTMDAFLEEISCVLEEGKTYSQTGFGSFKTVLAKERVGFNPSKKMKMKYPKKIKMKFK